MLQEINMKSTDFQPLKEYILIKPDDIVMEEKTSSGLILSSRKSVADRPMSGRIIALGSECSNLEVGDYIVFPNTDGIDIKFLDSDASKEQPQFMLLQYRSVIGKSKK